MTIVSCSGRFHAFALAEQLEKHGLLTGFYTSYAYQKNKWMRRFTTRVDHEDIPVGRIHTCIPVAILMQKGVEPYITNEIYDRWTSWKLSGRKDYRVFIGWSGMSFHTLKQAKKNGKTVIIERGSSHIQYQDRLLHEEYKKFGIDFHVDSRTIEKELREYEAADFISIPSGFVRDSFLEMGVPREKLVHNPYGTSSYFKKVETERDDTFRILYMGSLVIRKGLVYLFEALKRLKIPSNRYEVWFLGKVDEELKPLLEQYHKDNWKFFGHLNHYDLPKYISACDVAVQPSLEEGLSMVIPQMMGCGLPVIATNHTGGEDVITDGENGFIVPIQDPDTIADRITHLYEDRELLARMKLAAEEVTKRDFSWNNYGDRYARFIKQITHG